MRGGRGTQGGWIDEGTVEGRGTSMILNGHREMMDDKER